MKARNDDHSPRQTRTHRLMKTSNPKGKFAEAVAGTIV